MKKSKKNIFQPKGFTLLEVVIAVALISIGLISIYSLVNSLSSTASTLKGKLIASQLAQEGVEVVRNIRDENWMQRSDTWVEGLDDGTYIPVFYTDPSEKDSHNPSSGWSLDPIGSGEDFKKAVYIKYEDAERTTPNFYFQSMFYSSDPDSFPENWKGAPYKIERWIELNSIVSEEKLEITSVATWQERGITHRFEIKDYLYDWQVFLNACPTNYVSDFGNPTGISYYSGGLGDPEGADSCSGQEMILTSLEDPYRADSTAVCIGAEPFLMTFHSRRLSDFLCEDVEPDPNNTGNFYRVTNPF